MLARKGKGFYVEVNSFDILAVVTSAESTPLQIETLQVFPNDDDWQAFKQYVDLLTGSKSGAIRYQKANCGVFPPSRFFRKHTVESAAKAKDPGYFGTVMSEQVKVDPADVMAAALVSSSGMSFAADKPLTNQKEVLLCGARSADFATEQDALVEASVYPESLQMGTLTTLGALQQYLRWQKRTTPLLWLELGPTNAFLFVVSDKQVELCRPIPFGLDAMFPVVQEELSLKDEQSARKLFFSNTFDFTEMGPTLLKRIHKELHASMGFFEMQTGQSLGDFFVSLLPPNLNWITETLSNGLGLNPLQFDFEGWLGSRDITFGPEVAASNLEARWLGPLSLIGNFESNDGAEKE